MRPVDPVHPARRQEEAGGAGDGGAGKGKLPVLQPGPGAADAEGDGAEAAPVRRAHVLLLPLGGEREQLYQVF